MGSLDGLLIKLGGPKEWVPLHLQLPDERVLTGCYVRKERVFDLRHQLLEPIRVFGRGRWNRSAEGEWTLDKFFVDDFEPLNDAPLADVLSELQAIRSDWPDDPLSVLRDLRGDDA